MKILTLHVDYIKFKPLKKAIKLIEEIAESQKKETKVEEALAVLTAVEKGDTDSKGLVENIEDIANQINVKNIVLYPYAHLSSNLANPEVAVKILDEAEKILKKKFNVTKAPFGYYKEFELKVKGHPLSELSRDLKLKYGKGFNIRNIYLMRQFYINYQKFQTVSGKLSWSHYIELLCIEDDLERNLGESLNMAKRLQNV